MELVNPNTSFVWTQRLDIHGVPMLGIPEKQGFSFSRAGYLAALESPHLDADAVGKSVRQQLRPLSRPTLAKTRAEYVSREVVKFPRYFIIEPTAVCNRACPFCTILVTNRKGMMVYEDFAKLMDECAEHDVFGVSLYQLGEPFLWRAERGGYKMSIADMVNYAKLNGGFKIVNLSTNGDVSNLSSILGSELSDLIISIDGTTPSVYDANRPSTRKNDVGAFDRTLSRVHAFLEEKSKSGESRPYVRLQCINKENTADQILDFIRYWINVPGVDDAFIKNLDSMSAWLGDSVVGKSESDIKMDKVRAMPCQHLWSIGSMTADGSLNACCHDALTELTTAGANIREMSFVDWWNGEFMSELRKEHLGGATRSPCVSCHERDPWLG